MINVRDPAKSIAYAIEWADAPNAGSGAALTYNKARATRHVGRNGLPCAKAGDANATLIVRITEAGVGAASAEAHAGTLKLLVAPD